MATTYNNLYLDIRQQLRRAGIEEATLEARELAGFAAGKTREEFYRDSHGLCGGGLWRGRRDENQLHDYQCH